MFRSIVPYIGILLIFGLIGFAVEKSYNTPEILKMVEVVQHEYNMIDALPGAKLDDISTSHKSYSVTVTGDYISTASWAEVKNYYKEEMNSLGWAHKEEEYNKDTQTYLIDFEKDNYELEVEYSGKYQETGWDYAVSLDWQK